MKRIKKRKFSSKIKKENSLIMDACICTILKKKLMTLRHSHLYVTENSLVRVVKIYLSEMEFFKLIITAGNRNQKCIFQPSFHIRLHRLMLHYSLLSKEELGLKRSLCFLLANIDKPLFIGNVCIFCDLKDTR